MNMFAEIKDAVSTKEAASFYGLRIGRNSMCCCPFHKDKTPSMKVDMRFHCFGCGADGDVINFVQKYFDLDAKAAAHKLISDFRLNIETEHKETVKERNARIKRTKEIEYEKSVRAAYALELRDFRFKMAEFHRTLHRWSVDLEPTLEEWNADRTDPRFVAAHQHLTQLAEKLDIIDFGEDSEVYEEFKHREETITFYERIITEAEQRAAEGRGKRTSPHRSTERIA